jgi:diguanylate cyclase (GGDEF)-like protein
VLAPQRPNDSTGDDDDARWRLLRWGAAGLGAVALLGLGYRGLLDRVAAWHLASVLVLVAALAAVVPLTLRPGRERLAGVVAICCATCLVGVLAVDGGLLDAPILTLLPLLPVAAWFLLGGRAGWVVAAAGCLLLVGLSVVQRRADLDLEFRLDAELARPARALWLGATLLLLAGLTWLYERQATRLGRRLRHQATTDRLTGLENRRGFETVLEAECRRAARSGQPLSLVYFDIDHFKGFNDAYGHDKGDHCLLAVAWATSTCVRRSGDLVGRYGGEEFVALLPATDAAQARQIAETIRRTVEELEIPHSAAPGGRVTVSLGTATAVESPDPHELVLRADRALYVAKQAGRNRVESAP